MRARKARIIPAGHGPARTLPARSVNGVAPHRGSMVQRFAVALLLGGALLAAGCSSLKVAYGNAETLAWWWLDGYVDFERDQKPAAKAALSNWLGWHRRTQLPQYRQWLQQTAVLMQGTPTGEQICARISAADPLRAQALAPLSQPVADLAPRLQPAQLAHLEKRFAEKNAEWSEKHLQRDPQQRREAQAKRAIDNTERFYGRLDREQRRWLTLRLQASPYRAENDLSERQLRQRDAVATLRTLAEPALSSEQLRRISAAWMERLANPVDRPHAEARDAARHYLCDLAAEFHREQATPAQRRHLAEVLQGWQRDIDSFLQPPAAVPS
jgi:hypothetical protein